MRHVPRLMILGLCITAGCASGPHAPARAIARLEPRSGSTVSGTVRFHQTTSGVGADIMLGGLAPGSEHGLHIHEKGDCSAADAASAGGHFNPGNTAHGSASAAVHHAGDLPSIRANAAGKVRLSVMIPNVTLESGPNSILGRSVVVHRNPDDYTTQPSGNSGPRDACGVIGVRP
jgi:Cu-Zn family superoxide dismutase